MIIAAVFGIFAYVGIILSNSLADNEKDEDNLGTQTIQLAFSVFLAFWASGFDQFWTRREKGLAWKWGTTNLTSQEIQRPEYEGDFMRDELTGKMKIMPSKTLKNKMRTTFTYSCVIVSILVVVIAVVGIFTLKYYMNESKDWKHLSGIAPALLNAIQIKVLNILYGFLAVKLNDFENHETENLYNDNLALKLFLFKFVNCYSGLFYIAFIKYYLEPQDPNDDKAECLHGCMGLLGYQLMVIFMTNMFLNVIELGLPWFKWKLKLRSENKKIAVAAASDSSIRTNLYPVEVNSKLEPYESPLEDYMEMCIQFGYVALFGASFPLIAVLASIEIILEIRVDAWKLCTLTRRPDPNRSENIGVWKQIIVTIAYFGAITNAGIVVFTSQSFSDWSSFHQVLLFIALEHFLLLGMYVISILVPDVPTEVTDGLNWMNRIVTEKNLSKENTRVKTAEFSTSRGDERFRITDNDLYRS